MNSLQDQLKSLGFSASESATTESSTVATDPTSRQTIPIRIQRQTKGRKGKGVTVLFDLELGAADVQNMASQLRKKWCGWRCERWHNRVAGRPTRRCQSVVSGTRVSSQIRGRLIKALQLVAKIDFPTVLFPFQLRGELA